jgi:hypothetical protein
MKKLTIPEIITLWQQSGKRKYRNLIPRIDGKAREKALKLLSSNSEQTRLDPVTGHYEFLLHRGSHFTKKELKSLTSWTFNREVANSFRDNYFESTGKEAHLESTWIKEDQIHSLPDVYLSSSPWSDESEVIVDLTR